MNLCMVPEDYREIKKIGNLSQSDLSPSTEYFLIRIPKGIINPDDLINENIPLRSKKKRKNLKGNNVDIQYFSDVSPISVLVPESVSGRLKPVEIPFAGEIVFTSEKEVVKSSVKHLEENSKAMIPSLQRRSFVTSGASHEVLSNKRPGGLAQKSTPIAGETKKHKKSKKRKRNNDDDEEIDCSSSKKRKL